ncbi:MAG: serine acetyltransferase [Paracoccus sp. (in: a-proteobacteria)]|nr:serine acetyltransferase [Paracoccus sp. (in: a-proteobacteria)]
MSVTPLAARPKGTGLEHDIARLLGGRMPPPDSADSFLDIGGDPRMRDQLVALLEHAFGAAPEGWDSQPLRRLHLQQAKRRAPAPPLPAGDRNMNPPDIGFWDLVREDYETNGRSVMHQGFMMLFVHRFGNWRMSVRPRLLRGLLRPLYTAMNRTAQVLCGIKLDYTVKVGRRVRLEHFGGMILGAREIGDEVVLRQNTTMGIRSEDDLNAKPVLGKGVKVGAGAVIVGNIHIGDYSVIGANTVVSFDVPPHSIVRPAPVQVTLAAGQPPLSDRP